MMWINTNNTKETLLRLHVALLNIFILFLLVTTGFIATADEQATKQDFVEGKVVKSGLITLMYDPSNDQIFLQIHKQQLNTPFIFQSSLPQGIGSNDIGLDRGQLGATRLVVFERFGNKLFLNQLNTEYRANTANMAERKSIDEAFADSVIAGFTIVDESATSLTINYTDFVLSDIHGIAQRLQRTRQGKYTVDKSRSGVYLAKTKSFKLNTELEALVTFAGEPKGQYIQDVSPDAKSVSVHLHHSFIALPDDNFEKRKFHPFSGFWKHSFIDYSVPIDEQMEQAYIPKHRLKKVNPHAEKSKAIKPIVYYLDPGIPEPVMGALKEGALWWAQAFEAAGYQDAFQVKVLPEDADPMDVRYNVIQWVHRATRGWSYGSSVIDPRTGEIIKGHVTLGSLRVRQDFLIATGFTAPYKGVENADTSAELTLALHRIKQLSAHEVGHTLGIAHNFAASENNRASVMDYPHPLIQLNNNRIDLSNAYATGMGQWDLHTIAYGYQDFADNVEKDSALAKIIQNAKTKGLLYKSDPDARIAKRASADGHLWDNGSNPIDEFKRVSEVRRFALAQFGRDNLPHGSAYSDLERRLVPVYYSHRYQLDALVKQVSGIQYSYALKSQENLNEEHKVVTAVAAQQQNQALDLILQSASAEYLALSPNIVSLIPPKAYGSARSRESMPTRMGIAFDPVTAAESMAAYSLNILLQSERLNRLAYQHNQNNDIPSVKLLSQKLFNKLIKNNQVERLNQRIKMIALAAYFNVLNQPQLSADVKLDMQSVLLDYQQWLSKNKRKLSNQVLLKHMQSYWETGTWPLDFEAIPLPPGSPI